MTLFERIQVKRKARQEMRKKIDEKNARGFEKNLELEKGDLFAIVISCLFSFVLPIMLAIGAICGIVYFFFSLV